MTEVWEKIPLPVEHVIGIGAGLTLHRLSPARLPRRAGPLAWFLIGVGAAMNAVAVRQRGPGSIDRHEHLVTTGVHAVSRNPMYVGWSFIHLGLASALRAPWVLATWPVSFSFIHRAILREEAELSDTFGSRYELYRRSVSRYLGWKPLQ